MLPTFCDCASALNRAANALWTALCLCLQDSANFELLCAIPHERTGMLEVRELHLNQERWRQWLEKLQPVSLLKVIANRIRDTLHSINPRDEGGFRIISIFNKIGTSNQVIKKCAKCNPYVFGINAGYEKAQWHSENFSTHAGITTWRHRRATYVEIQGYIYSDPTDTTVFHKGSNKIPSKVSKTGWCHLHDDDELVMRVQLKSRSSVHKNVMWVLCVVSRAGFRRLSIRWSKWGSFLWSGSSQWTKYIDRVKHGWQFIFHELHMQDCVKQHITIRLPICQWTRYSKLWSQCVQSMHLYRRMMPAILQNSSLSLFLFIFIFRSPQVAYYWRVQFSTWWQFL